MAERLADLEQRMGVRTVLDGDRASGGKRASPPSSTGQAQPRQDQERDVPAVSSPR